MQLMPAVLELRSLTICFVYFLMESPPSMPPEEERSHQQKRNPNNDAYDGTCYPGLARGGCLGTKVSIIGSSPEIRPILIVLPSVM